MSRLRRRLLYAGLWLKSVVLRSTNSSSLYGLAVESYEDNDDPISVRSVALASKGPFGERWPTQLGDFQSERRDFDAACRSYDLALDTNPQFLPALRGMGLALQTAGRSSEAVYYYVGVLRQEPDDLSTLLNLTLVFMDLGLLDEAEGRLARATSIAADDPDVLEIHAQLVFERGRVDEAIKILEMVLTDHPNRCEVRRVLGRYYWAVRETGAAISVLRKALECDPDDIDTHRTLAELLGSDVPDEAVEHAKQAVGLLEARGADRDIGLGYWTLGWVYYLQGEWDASIEASRRALELGSHDSWFWVVRANLALAQLCAGQIEEARHNYRVAADLASDAWSLRDNCISDLEDALDRVSSIDSHAAQQILAELNEKESELFRHLQANDYVR